MKNVPKHQPGHSDLGHLHMFLWLTRIWSLSSPKAQLVKFTYTTTLASKI